MTLSIADIGTITGIMFALCAGFWAILRSAIAKVDEGLSDNSRLDSERCDGLGRRISGVEQNAKKDLETLKTSFNDYRVKVSDDYAKKRELQEVKIELKNLEKLVNDNHTETMAKISESQEKILGKLNTVEVRTRATGFSNNDT